jgi:phage host-nuclease inhibitor protein Gam
MSVKEFAQQQAKRIADAIESNKRTTRINGQVAVILERIEAGEPLKITRENVDADLFSALLALGVVSDVGGESKTPSQTNNSLAPKQKLRSSFKTPKTTAATSTVVFNPDERKFRDNARRLHELVSILEQDDMDEALREQYEMENDMLEKEQRLLQHRINDAAETAAMENSAALKTTTPEIGFTGGVKKRSSPPSQESAHRDAKKLRTGVARTLVTEPDEEWSPPSRRTAWLLGNSVDEDEDVDDKLDAKRASEEQE